MMSRKNDDEAIYLDSDDNDGDPPIKTNNRKQQQQKYSKVINDLQKENKKLSSDFKLMRDKLQLNDQATRIQFKLLEKQLEESKRDLDESRKETIKSNNMVNTLYHQLMQKLNTGGGQEAISPVDEEANPLLLYDDILVADTIAVHVDENDTPQQQQQQKLQQQDLQQQQLQQQQSQQLQQQQSQQQQLQQQQSQQLMEDQLQQPEPAQQQKLNDEGRNNSNDDEHFQRLLEERDAKLMKQMSSKDEIVKVLKEEVDALKQREVQRHRAVSFDLDSNVSYSDDGNLSEGDNWVLKKGASKINLEDFQDDDFEDGTQNMDERASLRMSIIQEELEHHFLPNDTYSYFAVADYFEKTRYFYAPTTSLALAWFALVVQLVTLSIFIMDVVDYKNARNPISVPGGVGIQVRVSQLIALLISCWNQDELRASFNVLSLGYKKEKVRAINHNATKHKWFLSIFIRLFVGCFALVVTFILIINSDTVRDVMLDFAAVTFVSELDNGVFQLSLWGYMGRDIQQFTMKIKSIAVYESTRNRGKRKKVPRLGSLLVIIGVFVGFWAWVTVKQEQGHYLDDAIFVQFGDDFSPALAAFSGIYISKLDNTLDGMRVNYVGLGNVELGRESGKFSYCTQDYRWIFQYGDEPDDGRNYNSWFSQCWHKARSSETEMYDITKTSDIPWLVLDEDLSLEKTLQHFLVKSQEYYYGKSCKADNDCGSRMFGSRMFCHEEDKTCVCKDDLFGLSCEFRKPCQTLEIDDSRDSNGFFGTRSWSRKYSYLSEDDNGTRGNSSTPIQVYGKPVYIGDESIEGVFDVILFTGRRWVLTDSDSIRDYSNNETLSLPSSRGKDDGNSNNDEDDDDDDLRAKRNLAEYLANNFHAYWSDYHFYFASEPVDAGSPTDAATPEGLQWFRLETSGSQGASLRSGDEIWQGTTNIEANLICTVCHNETNPCFYGAVCQADGTCDCTTGSSGSICQKPPSNNGNCDLFFNTPEFAFDGGDCCQETCTSTERYACGKGMLENSVGEYAYGFIGYPNCRDPRFKSKLSGSTTLYEIVERGFVRCGSGAYPGFLEISEDGVYSGLDVDLCKAIAGGALGDPDAFEIVETDWTRRWGDLTGGKFDVLLYRTTHNAERDIFEKNAKQGFSFAMTPNFFDGLRYAGIPPFSSCADRLDFESPECQDLRVCAALGTTWYEVTEKLFPESMVVAVDNVPAEVELLEAGVCNAIAGEVTFVGEFSVREWGFTGSAYKVGMNVYSKEPLSAVTLEDDRVWSKFVQWVFEALTQAEESGIEQSTADRLAPTDVFGEKFQNIFRDAVAASGNFGEIYERNLQDKIPRSGWNNVNTGSTGLIYSFPFGTIDTVGQGPTIGGTIETIRKRGVLHCGIKKTPGFAMLDSETGIWRGFEVDMCRGIAAALFNGSPNVNFIPLGGTERFPSLADGTIDVLTSTTTHTLAREIQEVTTGQGFDFTPAIFHDGLAFAGRPMYVGCAELRIFESSQECQNTKICAPRGSTWLETLLGPLNIPEHHIVACATQEDVYDKFISGECNAIVGEGGTILHSTLREFGLPEDAEYVIGSHKYSKEPLAIVSRSDDAQFSDFLRWIVFGFFYAEEQKITRDDYFDMPAGNYLFGNSLSNMWQHSIEAVGNYGEMFERNLEGIFERSGLNTLNDNGPQFYAKPGIAINYRK